MYLDLEENFGEFLEGWRSSEEVLKEPEEVVKKTNSREWMRVSDGWAKDGPKDAKKAKM